MPYRFKKKCKEFQLVSWEISFLKFSISLMGTRSQPANCIFVPSNCIFSKPPYRRFVVWYVSDPVGTVASARLTGSAPLSRLNSNVVKKQNNTLARYCLQIKGRRATIRYPQSTRRAWDHRTRILLCIESLNQLIAISLYVGIDTMKYTRYHNEYFIFIKVILFRWVVKVNLNSFRHFFHVWHIN